MFYVQKLEWYNQTKIVKLSECIQYNSYPKIHNSIRGDFYIPHLNNSHMMLANMVNGALLQMSFWAWINMGNFGEG